MKGRPHVDRAGKPEKTRKAKPKKKKIECDREFRVNFSMKEKDPESVSLNNNISSTIGLRLLKGTWFAFDENHIGVGDSVKEAVLEYIADKLSVMDQSEHEKNWRLFQFSNKKDSGGYRVSGIGVMTSER